MEHDRLLDLLGRVSEAGLVLAAFGALAVVGIVIFWPARRVVLRWAEVKMAGMTVPAPVTGPTYPVVRNGPGNGITRERMEAMGLDARLTRIEATLATQGEMLTDLSKHMAPLIVDRVAHAKEQLGRIEAAVARLAEALAGMRR